jgi:hypothetical protein
MFEMGGISIPSRLLSVNETETNGLLIRSQGVVVLSTLWYWSESLTQVVLHLLLRQFEIGWLTVEVSRDIHIGDSSLGLWPKSHTEQALLLLILLNCVMDR